MFYIDAPESQKEVQSSVSVNNCDPQCQSFLASKMLALIIFIAIQKQMI